MFVQKKKKSRLTDKLKKRGKSSPPMLMRANKAINNLFDNFPNYFQTKTSPKSTVYFNVVQPRICSQSQPSLLIQNEGNAKNQSSDLNNKVILFKLKIFF